LSKDIKNVSPLLLKPFKKNDNLPTEVRPLVDSLNFLLVKLEESMNKERKFIDYASHELRTPLTVIKTKTQFLIKKHKNDQELNEDLTNLLIAVDRIINLSNQLLILSRIDTENKIVKKEKFNLGFLTSEIAANFYSIAHIKNIKISTEIEGGCIIDANKFHMEILLGNLFDNAIKYSPNKEKVLVELKKEDKNIIFSIHNKGELISKDAQKHIFDRFYRAGNSNQDGSGLGLSIVKRIADLHEVKISFISEKQGNRVILNFNEVLKE
ncbi:MAG: signal transduction histidine kinase, partial [Rickettsiales bacterium]